MNKIKFHKAHIFLLCLIFVWSKSLLGFQLNPHSKEYVLDTLVYTSNQADTLLDSKIIDPRFFNTYFSKPTNFKFQFGYSTLWHWSAFSLENTQDSPVDVYLVVQNAMIEYLDFKQIDQITGKCEYWDKTGFSQPFDYRDIAERHFVFKINLKARSRYNILLRAKNNAGNLMVPLRLFNEDGYQSHQNFHHNVTTLTYAIWIMACFVALMMFFVLKESIYIFYFGYVFCLMMFWSSYEGISFELFWPNSSYLADISRNFYVPAAVSFGVFIMLIMTTSGRKLNTLKRVMKWIGWIFLPTTLLVCIPTEFNPVRNILVGVNDLLLVSLVLTILYAIGLKILERNEYTQLLIVALSPMLIFTLIQVLTFRGVLPISRNNFIIQYGFGFCALIEIILMFVLLAYRFRKILDIYMITQKRLDQTSTMLEDYKEALKIRQLKPSYFNSKLSEHQLTEILNAVEKQLSEKKLFKDPELSLQKLSESVQCKPHILSQSINQMAGTNFNDYVNSFRIKESESMLLDSKYNHISIEGIGAEVGFASKTSFYTTFKKTNGLTPKEFKVKNEVAKE